MKMQMSFRQRLGCPRNGLGAVGVGPFVYRGSAEVICAIAASCRCVGDIVDYGLDVGSFRIEATLVAVLCGTACERSRAARRRILQIEK